MESLFLSSLSSLRTTDEPKTTNILKGVDNKVPKTNLQSVVNENETLLCEIGNVLSSKQCSKILKNLSKQDAFQNMSKKYEKDVRNSSRLLTVDKNVSNILWERMHKIIEEVIQTNNISIMPYGFDVLNYEWKLNGINEGIRINCYNKKDQFFGYHKDGQFCNSGNERSIFSLVIYLNDNFKGGETNFYFEPSSKECKDDQNKQYLIDFTIKEEIDYFGGINNFKKRIISPKTGKAVIFSQNVIHEGCPIKSGKSKYILRTDIIVMKRKKENIGFAISTSESKDYLKALNYFREAQQLELNLASNDSNSLKKKCNEFYERSLNIRYSYPAKLLKQNKNKMDERFNLCMNIDVIWMIIFDYCDVREIEIMSYLYPSKLYPLIKLWQNSVTDADVDQLSTPLFMPKVFYSYGTYNIFEFKNADFFYKYEEQCCKVAAIYAFALLSNKYDRSSCSQQQFIINYNPYTQKALSVPFEELLTNVFYERKCFGAYFKVKFKVSDKVKSIVDHNLDRKFMSLCYGAQFVGGDCINEESFKFKYGQKVVQDDEWKNSKYVRESLVQVSELDDNGLITHMRNDYSKSYKKLYENNNLNNKNYINDLLNMNEYNHPSYARMFTGTGDKLTLNDDCNCSMHRPEGSFGACKDKVDVYNQLVFDFTQTKLTVNVDKGLEGNCVNCSNLHHKFVNLRRCLGEYIKGNRWGWGYKEFGYPQRVEFADKTDKYYTVNIEKLFDSKFDLSFYHACSNMVCVAEKGIDMKFYLNYTHLNHIHLASLKMEDGRVFVWAAYNAVAAL